jgi:hypothetical protein
MQQICVQIIQLQDLQILRNKQAMKKYWIMI